MDSQPMPNHEIPSDSWEFTEVEVRGHIIDSLILPKILDQITAAQGHFEIRDITIGERQTDPSYARLKVSAATPEQLQQILQTIFDHGAVPIESHDCHFEVAGLVEKEHKTFKFRPGFGLHPRYFLTKLENAYLLSQNIFGWSRDASIITNRFPSI